MGRLGQPNQTRKKKQTHTQKKGEITVLPGLDKPKEIKQLVKSHPKVVGRDGAETYVLKSSPEF